ncbi:hypothetical protein HDU98_008933 [Podochytrium sp. JEL0797]|nr:hypothetical protein HDU98_008933 [Podochytrium sp. JEL0797]
MELYLNIPPYVFKRDIDKLVRQMLDETTEHRDTQFRFVKIREHSYATLTFATEEAAEYIYAAGNEGRIEVRNKILLPKKSWYRVGVGWFVSTCSISPF